MTEIYRTSLQTDRCREELRFILSPTDLRIEMFRADAEAPAADPVFRLSLPLSLWPRFHEAVCCLGSFMIPLPAPAYQARPCCNHTCSLPPGPVVLELDGQEPVQVSLQDRRGSTCLEITCVTAGPAGNAARTQTVHIGPTLWSAFLTSIQTVGNLIAEL